MQKTVDAYNDMKNQLSDLRQQYDQLKDVKDKLEQNMLMSNKLLDDKAYGQSDLLEKIKDLMNQLQATKAENDSMKK